MISMLRKDIAYGVLGGAGIYLLCIFTSYLLYIPFFEKTFGAWLLTSVLVGGGISAIALLYKNHSAEHCFIRTLILFVSNTLILLFNGAIGIIRLLDKFLGIKDSEATSRASGLGVVLFLIGVFCVCMVINFVITVVRLVKKATVQHST
jgi:hypothetical protein